MSRTELKPSLSPSFLTPRHYTWLVLGFLALVVYGSLVPLHFQWVSCDDAVARLPRRLLRAGAGRIPLGLGGQYTLVHSAELFVDGGSRRGSPLVRWPPCRPLGAARLYPAECGHRVHPALLPSARHIRERCGGRVIGRVPGHHALADRRTGDHALVAAVLDSLGQSRLRRPPPAGLPGLPYTCARNAAGPDTQSRRALPQVPRGPRPADSTK